MMNSPNKKRNVGFFKSSNILDNSPSNIYNSERQLKTLEETSEIEDFRAYQDYQGGSILNNNDSK